MIGRKLVIASLFAALALVATAAGPARADDHRSGTWQSPGFAGWFNNNNNNRGDNDSRIWDRDRNSGRERDNWSRRNDDYQYQWRGRQERQEHDRGRHQGWWHNGHRDDGNQSWR